MGIFSGLLFVPLNALLQARSPADRRGAVIALANALVYLGMLAGSVLALVLARANVSPRGTFLGVSLVLLGGFFWAMTLVPDAFFRFLLIGLAHTVYRVRVIGRSNVPEQGGALLVPNHVSFADGLFLFASIDRPIRFIVYAAYFEQAAPGLVPAVDAGDPDLADRRPEDDPAGVPRGRPGTRRRRDRLRLPRGSAHADRDDGAVPARVAADRQGADDADHPDPPRPPDRQHLRPGQPPALARADPVPGDGLDRPADAAGRRRSSNCGRRSASWARRRGSIASAIAVRCITSSSAAPAAIPCAWPSPISRRRGSPTSRPWRAPWRSPAPCGRAGRVSRPWGSCCRRVWAARWSNLAAALAGHAAVNLNFTAGRAGMESAATQAGLRTVVTSRSFLEKAKLQPPVGRGADLRGGRARRDQRG